MINRKRMIEVAMEAAVDEDYGYSSSVTSLTLADIDPDYDWEPELFQAELEAGHREMGPIRPPTEAERTLMRMYEPMVLKMLEADSALLKTIRREYVELLDGSFTMPLYIDRND